MTRDTEFEELADNTLNLLYQKLGFKTLMVTRTMDDDWIVVRVLEDGQAVEPGTVYSWSDSICCRLVQDQGPTFAPDVDKVPAYASAPIRQQVVCRSYFGLPLVGQDGALLGTICGIDPNPRTAELESESNMMVTFAKSLGRLLDARLEILKRQRELDLVITESLQDPMTHLLNRRGWERSLAEEELRHVNYVSPGAVLIIDLDSLKEVNDTQGHLAGDHMILEAAMIIQGRLRKGDVTARLGGDEFGVILPETSSTRARMTADEIVNALENSGIEASIGMARRTHQVSYARAAELADAAMYEDKAMRKRRKMA